MRSVTARSSVTEVTETGEYHRHPVRVGGGDHVVVPDGAAGLDHRRGAGLGHDVEAVAEREEGVGGAHAALGGEPDLARAHDREPGGVHAVHLPGADADDLIARYKDDGVRLGLPTDAPGEAQRAELRVG